MTLPWTDHGKVLVHSPSDVNLLSNTCRHRQGLLLEGRGHHQNIVCPLHRWTYDLERPPAGCTGLRADARLLAAAHAADGMERTAVCRPAQCGRRPCRVSARDRLRLLEVRVRQSHRRRVSIQLEDVPRDLPRALSRRGDASWPAEVGRRRQLRMGLRRSLELPDPRHQGRTAVADLAQLPALPRCDPRVLRRRAAEVRHGVVDPVSERHARVVSRTAWSSAR